MLVEREVGGHDVATTLPPADTPAHFARPPINLGLNYRTPTRTYYYFFFEGPKGRYGPREAWAHMGWVGHPAH